MNRDHVDKDHEDSVEQFIEEARRQDPDRVAEVEERYPVLTERELALRRAREVGFTQMSMETGILTQSDRRRPAIPLIADLWGWRIAIPQF
ncbi:MAG TPA: hypothetical protein VI172_04085 [Candidatus Dormibacteraeota bacterium]|jgi:hypothetical protein